LIVGDHDFAQRGLEIVRLGNYPYTRFGTLGAGDYTADIVPACIHGTRRGLRDCTGSRSGLKPRDGSKKSGTEEKTDPRNHKKRKL
jgi:hypothetical protein